MVCGLGRKRRAAGHEVQLLLINQHTRNTFNYVVERNKEKLDLATIVWIFGLCLNVLLTPVTPVNPFKHCVLKISHLQNTGNGVRLNY